MDSIKYVQILEDNLLPIIENTDEELIYQQDNDPKHTAKITKAFFKNNNITTLEWPPGSPDLNPIENVWNLLKIKIHKRKPKNKEELIDIVTEEWLRFDRKVLKSLVNSMPKRVQQVIDNNGDITKY
jgi:transposase